MLKFKAVQTRCNVNDNYLNTRFISRDISNKLVCSYNMLCIIFILFRISFMFSAGVKVWIGSLKILKMLSTKAYNKPSLMCLYSIYCIARIYSFYESKQWVFNVTSTSENISLYS